jgi:hypothetical protein
MVKLLPPKSTLGIRAKQLDGWLKLMALLPG